MEQTEYDKLLKQIKTRDKMPYEDIIFFENKFQELKGSVTVNEFYKYVEKDIDKESFDVILKYLLGSTRMRIDKDSGCLYTAWNPVHVKEILERTST